MADKSPGIFSRLFGGKAQPKQTLDSLAPLAGEIGPDFQPQKGTFFRTLEYPNVDVDGNVIGREWMEAGLDQQTQKWALWKKSVMRTEDMLLGGEATVHNSVALFEKTNFSSAFDQMMTFELGQKALACNPLPVKTPAKLGGDYFRQFAWREGLMMSRSGRLYPFENPAIASSNSFAQEDFDNAKAFLERNRNESFIPVPITLPVTDWADSYAARKVQTDERLNILYQRYNGDKNSHELALQVVGQEAPEVLYAHLQNGFTPKVFAANAEQHYMLAKAAIDRTNIEVLSLLEKSGLGFYVRHDGHTPLEYALEQKRYSHVYLMLSRDGAQLAKYEDDLGNAPVTATILRQDNQAFRMIYNEGIDFAHVDAQGWALVHHAFANNFMAGIYAWQNEGLPLDQPVKGTAYTCVSIARQKGNQALVDYAVKNGANPNAPDFPANAPAAAPAPIAGPNEFAQKILAGGAADILAQLVADKNADEIAAGFEYVAGKAAVQALGDSHFLSQLLNTDVVNTDIQRIATAYTKAGGDLTDDGLFETCWKNVKPKTELNRRSLIPILGALGADASAALPHAASGAAFDLDFIKAIAPFVKNPNAADGNGNNILHALQLNSNDQVGRSANAEAILKLFPALDINAQNQDGYSAAGLAIRLDRSQTLKALAPRKPDLAQVTSSDWSYLNIAFTKACGQAKVAGAPRADRILVTSDAVRFAVLDIADKVLLHGTDAEKSALRAAIDAPRPDGKTLLETMTEEGAPAQSIQRLKPKL